MNKTVMSKMCITLIFIALSLAFLPCLSYAVIPGVTGTTFDLTAKEGYIYTGDGDSVYMWGYALDTPTSFCPAGGCMQYPGPTIIVNQGDTITVNLTNQIPGQNVSIVFPGHTVTATGGTDGLITKEALPGGTVSYQFTASEAGTYTYFSGTQPDLQDEMGLVGALIIRPAVATQAYDDPSTAFDREYLFLLSDMDPSIHKLIEFRRIARVDITKRHPVLWFINGRNLPDIMAPAFASWLPNQPYNCMPMMHPGEKVLMRIIGAGSDMHPLHTHGSNHLVIARDGRLLKTASSTSPDLSYSDFTTTSVPGETVDAIWGPWTGEKLGWDIYGDPAVNGHTCNNPTGFDTITYEYCPDHGKPVPVTLPDNKDLTFGQFTSGSPFLGTAGELPPGEGGFNPYSGFFYMWHSHNEKELTNNNIFIGGMATMALVVPPGVPIP